MVGARIVPGLTSHIPVDAQAYWCFHGNRGHALSLQCSSFVGLVSFWLGFFLGLPKRHYIGGSRWVMGIIVGDYAAIRFRIYSLLKTR